MAPQITVSPEQPRPGEAGDGVVVGGRIEGRKGRPHRRCLCRAPTPARWAGIAGAHRRSPGRARSGGWLCPPPPRPHRRSWGWGWGVGGERGREPARLYLPSLLSRANSPRWVCDGAAVRQTFPTPGRRGMRLGWLPYVFNKIRQIGPGDRDCSKPVIKQQKLGQCKRQKGPSLEGPLGASSAQGRLDQVGTGTRRGAPGDFYHVCGNMELVMLTMSKHTRPGFVATGGSYRKVAVGR